MAKIGSVIDGKYKILEKIGQGGMSVVYLAMDSRLNKQWAVKEIRKIGVGANNEIIVQSLLAEANLMKKLDHPALPRIVDIIDNGKTLLVIMDYIEGEPLSRVLDENGPQPQSAVIEWGKQLCLVLEYLHNRQPPIIYRDMKPANVMLKPDGSVKLIDFGIAREYKADKTEDTTTLGTRGYAAPEQLSGKIQTDARTDIYCLGVTLYHLVTGQSPCEPPYELYPIRHWNQSLSAGLERIILKCTMQNPEDRYQSCAEMLYDLEHYEQMEDSYRSRQKKKLVSFVGTAAFALVFLFMGIGCGVGANTVNNANYDTKLALAANTAEEAEKLALLGDAIDIKPTEVQGYLEMVNAMKADAVFTTAEQATLQAKLNSSLEILRTMPDYPYLAFEIGKLYWYYYDYGTETGDNLLTRVKSAVPWFADVVQYGGEDFPYYNMAMVYRDIGRFNQSITLNIEEASDKGRYAPYWDDLRELAALLAQNPDESEIVKLEFYRLALNAIESYATKFKADGISREDMVALCEQAAQGAQEVETNTDKTMELQAYLIQRAVAARDAVERAFQ